MKRLHGPGSKWRQDLCHFSPGNRVGLYENRFEQRGLGQCGKPPLYGVARAD